MSADRLLVIPMTWVSVLMVVFRHVLSQQLLLTGLDCRQRKCIHFMCVPNRETDFQETRLKSSFSVSLENEANTWCRGLVRKSISWDALCSSQRGDDASTPKQRDSVKPINPTRESDPRLPLSWTH